MVEERGIQGVESEVVPEIKKSRRPKGRRRRLGSDAAKPVRRPLARHYRAKDKGSPWKEMRDPTTRSLETFVFRLLSRVGENMRSDAPDVRSRNRMKCLSLSCQVYP
jgi:hypothetical protein